MPEARRDLTILLVEDDDGHATLIERNLIRAGLSARIIRARSGPEALDTIMRNNGNGPGPLVILLDIRMPGVEGTEVLRRLKSSPDTAPIPVYVLTTSDDQREVQRCFRLGCNAYITKPVAYEAFVETVQNLANFFRISQVPGESSQHI